MKISLGNGLSILVISSLLVGCQASDQSAENTLEKEAASVPEVQEQTNDENIEESEHDHSHAHEEETDKISSGYFEDSQVKDRALSDWNGDWQSVYPYLEDGTLDEVFANKAEHGGKMSAEDYKAYYQVGYQTDVDRIVIKDDIVTFYKDGKGNTGEYLYDGYEILTYEAGNRGVRYIFKLQEGAKELPQYLQFSDHIIAPKESSHYHLYWGNDRQSLLEEVNNWPTFFPSEMSGHEISHDMMAH